MSWTEPQRVMSEPVLRGERYVVIPTLFGLMPVPCNFIMDMGGEPREWYQPIDDEV